MTSGHKTSNVFERYNIGNDNCLKPVAQIQRTYLKTQMTAKNLKVSNIVNKKRQEKAINPLIILVPEAGI